MAFLTSRLRQARDQLDGVLDHLGVDRERRDKAQPNQNRENHVNQNKGRNDRHAAVNFSHLNLKKTSHAKKVKMTQISNAIIMIQLSKARGPVSLSGFGCFLPMDNSLPAFFKGSPFGDCAISRSPESRFIRVLAGDGNSTGQPHQEDDENHGCHHEHKIEAKVI